MAGTTARTIEAPRRSRRLKLRRSRLTITARLTTGRFRVPQRSGQTVPRKDVFLSLDNGGRMLNRRFRSAFLISGWLLFAICSPSAVLSASPVELISNFRVSQGLGRVTMDATLNRIAQEQATAMAARDLLDHGAAGSFSSRVASLGSRHAAENIAYGYDSFTKTLDQWINSSGHRKNLRSRHSRPDLRDGPRSGEQAPHPCPREDHNEPSRSLVGGSGESGVRVAQLPAKVG